MYKTLTKIIDKNVLQFDEFPEVRPILHPENRDVRDDRGFDRDIVG